ncbi:MAG: transketolase [Candidatus Peregrinibacteria bacterium]|nr:transketolase [Candidatus Peregrinibacteria bacterium]
MNIPNLGEPLNDEHISFLQTLSTACRRSIIEMVSNAQSGHPGGSLSVIDYLSLLYAFVISRSNEPVVVSNGHVSPAVYAILGELGVVDKERAIKLFRKPSDVFEGHVNRKVRGVHYSTGPLGVGSSVASAFALGNHLKKSPESVYLLMGDGEQQEGQAYEMMNFASKYALSNLVLFIDYNKLQLSASLDTIMPTNIAGHYRAAGWEVIEVDGHDYQAMWNALSRAKAMQMVSGVDGTSGEGGKPVCLIAHTIMGKGVSFMEAEADAGKSSWHGNATNKELTEKALSELTVDEAGAKSITDFLGGFGGSLKEKIFSYDFVKNGSAIEGFNAGTPKEYPVGKELFDCRGAYGNALTDLAGLNMNVVAMTADLAGSVKTDGVKKAFPERHIECGIAEQHMVSAAGGLSLRGFIPFCSTFGAFMTSRAKDQARVNDINETNAKMVSTHCGLSVGEDGPTHQAIDDIGSFMGFFNTSIFEPADANQCDRIIRRVASIYGNVYVRMGRSKLPILTTEDGSAFFGGAYEFKIGKADVLRNGKDITIVASGPMVTRALEVRDALAGLIDVEIVVVSSLKPFDTETVAKSAKKTGAVLTIEDHEPHIGLGMLTTAALKEEDVNVPLATMGVRGYQLSGTADELYEEAGLGMKDITKEVEKLAKRKA